MVEYDKGKAKAIVEYKHEYAEIQHSEHASYKALIDLAGIDRHALPVFGTRYTNDFTMWEITSLNRESYELLRLQASTTEIIGPTAIKLTMNEREWVEFLYKIRGRNLPNNLFNGEKLLKI
jgi:hypothetical protein